MSKASFSKRVSWRIEYLGYRGLEHFISLLSPQAVDHAGALLGSLFYHLSPRYRRLALRNLRLAFGDELPLESIRELALQTCQRTIANFAGTAKTSLLSTEKVSEQITLHGIDELNEALKLGRGALLVLGHMGNWEVLNRLHQHLHPGTAAGGVYQPLKNPLVNAHVIAQRRQDGTQLFSKRDGFHSPASFVKNGGLLIVVADQKVGRAGEPLPFFGRLSSLSPLPALLARKAGAPVFAAGIETVSPGQWRVTMRPLGTKATTQKIISLLESLIKESPADYLWLHNRWRIDGLRPLSLSSRKRKPTLTTTKPLRVLLLADQSLPEDELSHYLAQRVAGDLPLAFELLLPEQKKSPQPAFPTHYFDAPTPEQLAAHLTRIDYAIPAPLELLLIHTPSPVFAKGARLAHLPKVVTNSKGLPLEEFLSSLTTPNSEL